MVEVEFYSTVLQYLIGECYGSIFNAMVISENTI